MREFGIFILFCGIAGIVYALRMDVTVPSPIGMVNNVGLMSDRQNFVIASGFVFLGGVMMALLGGRQERNNNATHNNISGKGSVFAASDLDEMSTLRELKDAVRNNDEVVVIKLLPRAKELGISKSKISDILDLAEIYDNNKIISALREWGSSVA